MRLVPASFKGAVFHVEQQVRSSGRRTVEHEYPKRDLPYAEDMGRHAVRYNVTGPNYLLEKEDLIQALESEDAGQLVDPYRGSMLMMCERYAVIETREKGGYCVFEMAFCEAGVAGNSLALLQTATRGDVNTKADAAAGAMSETLDQVLAPTP